MQGNEAKIFVIIICPVLSQHIHMKLEKLLT
jgi:hypothetical protein